MDFFLSLAVLLVSAVASFVGVVSGGSSLVMVPALAVLGVPIHAAIATNRVYTAVFTLAGVLTYLGRRVRVDWAFISGFLVLRVAGSFVGSNVVLGLSAETVKALVAVFMAAAMAAMLFLEHYGSGRKTSEAGGGTLVAAGLAFLLLGFYEGFVGGGSGVIIRVILIMLFGFTLLEAALAELVMSFATSLTASAVFVSAGQVDYALLVPMVLGGVAGAFLGSTLAVKREGPWMRHLLFLVVGSLIAKMFFF